MAGCHVHLYVPMGLHVLLVLCGSWHAVHGCFNCPMRVMWLWCTRAEEAVCHDGALAVYMPWCAVCVTKSFVWWVVHVLSAEGSMPAMHGVVGGSALWR